MSTTTHKPVLIVGAGMGGLALAQRLKAAAVPFRLFERDIDSSSRAQGWSLSLSRILRVINTKLGHLQPSVYANAVNAELGGNTALAMIDGYTGESLMRIPHEVNPDDGTPTRIQANRSKLRRWLAQGLDIEWNKRYESHATLPDEGVCVTFTDGTSATGSCLVGADGVHSGVRHNLFATAADPPELVTAPVNYIFGTRTLAMHDYEQLLGLYTSKGGAHTAALGTNKRLVVALRTVKPDLSEAELIWYLSYLPSSDDPQPGEEQTREALLAKAVEKAGDLVEPLREMVSGTTDLDEVSQVVVRSIIIPDIPNGLVTLLGDAAHAMTPHRGEGAQHAVQDGFNLAEAIILAQREAEERREPCADYARAFKEYEAEMVPRGHDAVKESRAAVFFMHRPIEAWRASAAQQMPQHGTK